MTQPTLFGPVDTYGGITEAREAGDRAAEACAAKAKDVGWDRAGASAFILAYLEANGPTPGEVLVSEQTVHAAG